LAEYVKKTVDCIYPSALFGDFFKNVPKTLNDFGYSDVVLLTNDSTNKLIDSYEQLKKNETEIKIPEIHRCFEIVSENPQEIHNLLRKHRSSYDLLCVRSNKEKSIRAAVENERNDFIIPTVFDRPGLINQVVAKAARDNSIAFAFEMLPLLKLRGYKRVKYIECIRLMLPSLNKYDVPIIFMTGAKSQTDLRDQISLSSFGFLLDFDIYSSEKCISSLGKIINENLSRKSGKTVADGITVEMSESGEFD